MPQHFLSEILPISYLLMSVVGWVKRNTKLKSKFEHLRIIFLRMVYMLMNTIDFMIRVFLKIKRFVKNQKCWWVRHI